MTASKPTLYKSCEFRIKKASKKPRWEIPNIHEAGEWFFARTTYLLKNRKNQASLFWCTIFFHILPALHVLWYFPSSHPSHSHLMKMGHAERFENAAFLCVSISVVFIHIIRVLQCQVHTRTYIGKHFDVSRFRHTSAKCRPKEREIYK